MKLSTRSRYGTRLMLDMALRYGQGPIQLREISKRQKISIKYLEQIVRPLKKAGFVVSARGPKGGHMLGKAPDSITIGEIVALLEGSRELISCVDAPEQCGRIDSCATRYIWMEASRAMFERLNGITLEELRKFSVENCRRSHSGR